MTTCDTCGKTYQSGVQPDMFSGKSECLECLTKAHVAVMLAALPSDGDDTEDESWERLTRPEQKSLLFLRGQFTKNGTLTDKEYRSFKRLYEKFT